MTRINIDVKLLLSPTNYILKAKRMTAVETDEIKENITQNMECYRRSHKTNEWRQNGCE